MVEPIREVFVKKHNVVQQQTWKRVKKIFMRLTMTDVVELFGEDKSLWKKKGLRARGDANCWTAVYVVFGPVNKKDQDYFVNKEGKKLEQERKLDQEQDKKTNKKQRSSPKV